MLWMLCLRINTIISIYLHKCKRWLWMCFQYVFFLPVGSQICYYPQYHQTPYHLSQALGSAWGIMAMTEHQTLPRKSRSTKIFPQLNPNNIEATYCERLLEFTLGWQFHSQSTCFPMYRSAIVWYSSPTQTKRNYHTLPFSKKGKNDGSL